MYLFKGYISRIEFALGFLVVWIFAGLFSGIADTGWLDNASLELQLITPAFFGILAVVLYASILVRRLDDIGYKNYFVVIYLIPPAALLAIPFLLFVPSTRGTSGFRLVRVLGLETPVEPSPIPAPVDAAIATGTGPDTFTPHSLPAQPRSKMSVTLILILTAFFLMVPVYWVMTIIQNQAVSTIEIESTATNPNSTQTAPTVESESLADLYLSPGSTIGKYTVVERRLLPSVDYVELIPTEEGEVSFMGTLTAMVDFHGGTVDGYNLFFEVGTNTIDQLPNLAVPGDRRRFRVTVSDWGTSLAPMIDTLCQSDCTPENLGELSFEEQSAWRKEWVVILNPKLLYYETRNVGLGTGGHYLIVEPNKMFALEQLR